MKKNLLIAMIIASATILKAQTTTGLSPKPPMAKTTDSLKKDSVAKPAAPSFSKFRLGVSGGLSFLLAKISEQVPAESKDYVRDLKSGAHFSVDASYFWKEQIGLGFKYINFTSSNEGRIFYDDGSGFGPSLQYLEDNITTQFFGPVLYSRYYSKNRKTELVTGFGLGYLDYRDNGNLNNTDVNIKGGTIGLNADISADFYLTKNLSLGLGIGLVGGTLRKLERQVGNMTQTIELEEGNYESLTRLDIFTGLRWKL
ncbi:hypothetical protein FYC62_02335 [Pedobacter aquae]|uniref:Outer membrane protein beta-barrel domain-containing protein n=1 Tax=Pedobacter aquae TaxID=2605747 RepID=A0A5C0VGA1_9SPHI|nr:hypothetical protein [Pedobacter aquae]QEK50631.1 hypothetical protein FYC62_02335 [Pedobacter aquae]